jgi:ATP-dependent DNA helicase RecG
MDFSVINELPAGRKLIKTKSIVNNQDKLIEKIRSHFDKDEKSFVVFPLIEETEKMDLLSAEQGFEALSKVFGSENVELLHGKMKSDKKISVMDRFANKKVKILVSTTVIEVGIDVPEATLMIVMNAERFGLSQLHQLRGRVGRSNLPSECLLYTEHKKGARIKIMEKYNDGFDISREDFKLRGPGEIMGTSQSGVPPFKLFNVFRDRELVELSHDMIGEIKREYGGFNHPDLRNIELIIEKFYKEKIKYSEIL